MEIFLKALIAAVLTLVIERIPKYLSSRRIRERHSDLLMRDWYGYHFSFKQGEPALFKSEWVITKGIMTPFKLSFAINNTLKYNGKLVFEGDDRIIFYGKSTTQEEYVVFRFPNPIGTNIELVRGLWLSYDHDKHISSGGFLLSSQPLTDTKAEEELKKIDIASFGMNIPLMRVTK